MRTSFAPLGFPLQLVSIPALLIVSAGDEGLSKTLQRMGSVTCLNEDWRDL